MKMNRILLKLSGEALGENGKGFSEAEVSRVAAEVKKVSDKGIQIGVVIGGGNFWRGRTSNDMDRVKADQIGMLATVMNAIYAADCFSREGMTCHVMTPYAIGDVSELYVRDKAIEYLEKGDIVFFAGGTGHPYFSTDTGVVLRAIEVEADYILLAKAIDGVYDSDPAKNSDAKRYDTISIDEVIEQNLQVVDMTASILARDNHMPMRVFALQEVDSIVKASKGEFNGTTVTTN